MPLTGITKVYLESSFFLRRIVKLIPMLHSIVKVQHVVSITAMLFPRPTPLSHRRILKRASPRKIRAPRTAQRGPKYHDSVSIPGIA
jgi:hypothetical protein